MRKYKVLILSLTFLFVFLMFSYVNAAISENTIDTATAMLSTNKIVLNNAFYKGSYNLMGEVGTPVDATYQGLRLDVNDDETGTLGLRSYDMYYISGPNASVTRRYKNIGRLDDNTSKYDGYLIGADMTISDLKMGNGSKSYDYSQSGNNNSGIGFNKYYLGFVLFEGYTNGYGTTVQRGSVAKITIRFFISDGSGNPVEYNANGSVKYLYVDSSYMGIGGYGSEKLVSNGSESNVLGAPQWEWSSFDNTASGNVKGYHDPLCNLRIYSAGWTGTATDYDGNTKNYGWAVAPSYSFTNMATANVTGRQVVSNGGNRFATVSTMEVMGVEYTRALANYSEYRESIKKGFYMFENQKATVNGNTVTQISFEFGKSYGTVELGLRPVLLANYFPGDPVKAVDKTTAHEGETLKYTITQKTGFLQSNARTQIEFDEANTVEKYNSMSIVDTLPDEVTYAGNLVVKRSDTGEILSNGSDYTVSPSGNTLTITFTQSFLKNRMGYIGENYIVTFDAKVNDLTYAQAKQNADNGSYTIYTANNVAQTIINGSEPHYSNKVRTQIVFDILTKSVNTTISEKITNIPGGTNGKTVVFTPNSGFYIESVEWQNQSDKYDSSISDIPSTNKVTIPVEKDGSESTYKFKTSITDGNNYDPFGTTVFTFDNIDNNHYVKVVAKAMKMVIQVSKEDRETGKTTQGDAKFVGAEYTVYTNYDESTGALTNPVDKIVLDANGNGSSSELDLEKTDANGPYGEYFVKETKAPEGYLLDEQVYRIYETAEQQTAAREKVSYHSITSKENVIRNHIEIIKDLGETSNTSQFPLDKCEFTATLVSSIGTDHEFSVKCSAPTDENGYCIIEDLPYGTYIVKETTVSPISLRCADFTVFVEKDKSVKKNPYVPKDGEFSAITLGETIGTTKTYSKSYEWLDAQGHIVDVPKVMQIKIRKVDKDGYENGETPTYTQGDAVLKGAIYQIYRYDPKTDDYTEYVYDITVDHKDSEGYWCAESDDLLVGKYMVKEKIKYSETVEGKTYNYSYAEGYLTDPETYYFEQQPDKQTVRRTYQSAISKEEVIRGRIQVIKYNDDPNSSIETPAEGAILRLTLDSNKDIWYEVKIDKYGYGDFVDTNDDIHTTAVKSCYGEKYSPYTIPYGKYTITETQESNPEEHTYFFIQPEKVTIEKEVQKEYRIESDIPIPVWLKIIKLDEDTNQIIKLEGAKFKIWDVQNKEWVTQMKTPSGEMINEFEINDEGYLYTPQQLYPGEYVVYETQAPKGYYLQDNLRVPENANDLGDDSVSGKKVIVNKIYTGLKDDTIYPEGGVATGELVIEVPITDPPLKVNLEIHKKGEKLTGVTTTTVEYPVSESENKKEEKYTPTYSMENLEGVGYKVYAAEDTYTPDGIKRYSKNQEVADITTNSEGIAIAEELYPGEYRIVEYKTPTGYITDNNISNVTLVNEDQYVRVATKRVDLSDARQKLQLTFKKEFKDVNFANGEELEQQALFGVYTKNAIKNYKNTNTLVPADGLVDLIWTDENNDVTSQIDLPEGTYYVKELYVSYPYTLNVDTQEFTLRYNGKANQEFVVHQGEEIINDYDSSSITLVKLSTSTFDNIILNGDEIVESTKDEDVEKLIEEFKGMTEAEIREYLNRNEVKFVSGATYRVYTDNDCTKPLYIKSGDRFVEADIITDETGMIKLENIPLGKYYIKEISAPKGYQLSEDVVEIELSNEDKDTMIYKALLENSVVAAIIDKSDIFTGEAIPNCKFEIADENGKVLLHSITNKEGKGYIPVDLFENGKKYTYTEIEAPEMYEINTEPYEFIAKYDEDTHEWLGESIKVENTRKKGKVIVSYIDIDTGLEIADKENTEDYVGYDYDTFVKEIDGYELIVELIPVNKDGQYTIEDIYVKYYYRKIDNAPTGDINVYMMSLMLLISATSVVYILKRKLDM